jgi:hypothetical protein
MAELHHRHERQQIAELEANAPQCELQYQTVHNVTGEDHFLILILTRSLLLTEERIGCVASQGRHGLQSSSNPYATTSGKGCSYLETFKFTDRPGTTAETGNNATLPTSPVNARSNRERTSASCKIPVVIPLIIYSESEKKYQLFSRENWPVFPLGSQLD